MNQDKKISLYRFRTGCSNNTKNQIKNPYDFAFKIGSNDKYQSGHHVIYNPTGNCQIYSLANFNTTVSSIHNILRNNQLLYHSWSYIGDPEILKNDENLIVNSVIDYICWTRRETGKNLLLLDLTKNDYQRYGEILKKLRVISTTEYVSTRTTDMVILLIDVRDLRVNVENIFKLEENE